jgi:hypothetical protein
MPTCYGSAVTQAHTLNGTFNTLKPKLVKIIFKNSVRTAKKTQHLTNFLTLFKEIVAVYSEIIWNRQILSGQNAELLAVKAGEMKYLLRHPYRSCVRQTLGFCGAQP